MNGAHSDEEYSSDDLWDGKDGDDSDYVDDDSDYDDDDSSDDAEYVPGKSAAKRRQFLLAPVASVALL